MVLGVGSTDEYSSGNSTTAGMIGFGYLYTNFNAGITYTTPNMAGLMLSVGIMILLISVMTQVAAPLSLRQLKLLD